MIGAGARRRRMPLALTVAALAAACGKEGPPLPPLVRTPVAPAELTAERRGDAVDLQFVIPNANTDGSRPADIRRVEVYAITGPATVTDEQLLDAGTRIGTVEVRPPADEDAPPPEKPVTDVAVAAAGVEQGARAHVGEDLTPETFTRAALPDAGSPAAGPLLGPPPSVPTRIYATVGVSERGRRGPFSTRAAVPLVPAPPPPAQPSVTYDEARAVVSWSAAAAASEASSAARSEPADATAATVLPSTSIGMPSAPTTGYYVYELAASEDAAAPRVPQRLTEKPVTGTAFEDERIVWGAERCYAVSAVRRFDSLSVESEASLPRCVTFTDTFPPPVPTNVTAVASAGAISLIWDPSKAADLAGYIVLRGTAAAAATALTASPVQEASFRDTTVTAGDQYVYSVRAVDKAGNLSAPSEPVEETAR